MEIVSIKTVCLRTRTLGFGQYQGFQFCTLELPWKSNKRDHSCIDHGYHLAHKVENHRKFKKCFYLPEVEGRSGIYVHSLSLTKDTLGCIGIGLGLRDIDDDNKLDLTGSVPAIQRLWAMLPDTFTFHIRRMV